MAFDENENIYRDDAAPDGTAPEERSDIPPESEQSGYAPSEREQRGSTPPAPEQPGGANRVQPVQSYAEEHESWRDPSYEAAGTGENPYSPGRYAYGAQNWQQPAPEPEKPKKEKKKRGHGFLKAACLVVVCALAAGAASWAVMDYMLKHSAAPGTHQVTFNTVAAGGGVQTMPPSEGGVLTGNDIYNLGLKQVVGVNTSFTTNIFGMATPRAVSGSGFIIDADGYILTNYHVISYAVVYGGELTVLLEDGTKYPAEVVGYMESNDVAVIKIDASGLSPVTLGDSDAMQVGEWVYAIGNPLGELEYTMTPGIVSARDRVITTSDDITGSSTSINMFQISAAVNHGNSGGPVYNSRGEVIGIVTAKYSDADEGIESLGFAIPINDAVNIATQLIEKGYVAGAGLGITGWNVDDIYTDVAMETYNIPYGVYVESVNEGSAAEAAGIRRGDIITALGDAEVSSMDELKMMLRRYTSGDTETVTVYRMETQTSGESMDLTITFQELVEDNSTEQQPSQGQDGGYSGGGNGGTLPWPWSWGW